MTTTPRPLYETRDAAGNVWLRTRDQTKAQERADKIGGTWRALPISYVPAEPTTPDAAHEVHAVFNEHGVCAGWVWRDQEGHEHDGHEHWSMETVGGYQSPFGYTSHDAASNAVRAIQQG